MIILIDTREQKPLWTKNTAYTKIERTGLVTGDYSIKGLEHMICIERKSTTDLFTTLGRGHKRFKRELERASELDYFAIVIENNYSNIKNKDFEGSYNSKMRGYVVTKILLTIHQKYKIPVFMCKDRAETKTLVKDLLSTYYKLNNDKNRKI